MRYSKSLFILFFLFCIGSSAQTADNAAVFQHTVEKGQSLYSIAAMYGVTTYEIIALNPEAERVIRIGEKLRIPQKMIQKNTTGNKQYHTIQSGETLYRLTQQYHVSANAICQANPGLTAENFQSGKVIVIPTDSIRTAPTAESAKVEQKKFRDIHKVEKKETVYSISRMYQITEQELLDANPEIAKKNGKLKKGSYLSIPYPKKNEAVKDAPSNEEMFAKLDKGNKSYKSVKAAVLLPFSLSSDNKNNAESKRMLDYYRGFLLAVDSLKHQGYSMNIYTYDIADPAQSVDYILKRPEMTGMNILFGPVQSNDIKKVAAFAQKNKIRMVIPFSSKGTEVFNNANVYQVNTPQSYLYSEVYSHFLNQFSNSNVIFINVDKSTDKADFIKGLKTELTNRQQKFSTVSLTSDLSQIAAAMKPSQNNVFVPTGGDLSETTKVIKLLNEVTKNNTGCKVSLFGYPEYQAQTRNYADFYHLNTYFYATFFSESSSSKSRAFDRKMVNWYEKEQIKSIPRFAMLGFDTGYFFLKGLAVYGSSVDKNINKIQSDSYQSYFRFDRVNNWGGFINRKVVFIHFTPNKSIQKIEF